MKTMVLRQNRMKYSRLNKGRGGTDTGATLLAYLFAAKAGSIGAV
jgi:aspartokinase